MRLTTTLRCLLAPLAGAAWLLAAPSAAGAAELVMLERPGCAWCERWDREIAPIYPQSAEGRVAPLRRVDVTAPWPDDLAGIERDFYTPTFIVVDDGKEVARLRGYPGDNFFWPLLGDMLDKLPAAAPQTVREGDSG